MHTHAMTNTDIYIYTMNTHVLSELPVYTHKAITHLQTYTLYACSYTIANMHHACIS